MKSSSSPRRSITWRSQIGLELSPAEVAARHDSFEQFVQEHPYPEELSADVDPSQTVGAQATGTESTDNNDSTATHNDLDPLTAMLLEDQAVAQQQRDMDLEYRKELARRKRIKNYAQDSIFEEELSLYDRNLAALQTIDKDLNRLAHPSGSNAEATAEYDGPRKEVLRLVLYIYNCRHEIIGYRQGMHEIASWLMWALESDQDGESAESDECPDYSQLAAECYFMTETLLTDIQAAYDVGEHKPMEQMSRRVVDLVAKADVQLRHRLDSLGIPPAIYLTKWIRLLFSREVLDVMAMWDAMFDAKQDGFAWMMILEATAAARLLQHRQEILQSSDDGLLHLLMNMPPEEDVHPLLEYLQPLLRGDTIVLPVIDVPVLAPPNEAHPADHGNSNRATAHNQPLFSAQSVGSLAAHFSGVKESIAAQTQSISKRLMQEWEAIQTENQQGQRSYDDGFWNQSLIAQANSLDSPIRRQNHASPQSDHIRVPNNTPLPVARANYPPHTWAFEMEYRLGVVQNFVMLSEQQRRGSVTPAVWEALADLEEIRQAIQRNHCNQNHR